MTPEQQTAADRALVESLERCKAPLPAKAAERIKALLAERQTMRESFEAIQFYASQGLSPGNDYRLELRLKLNKETKS